MFIENWNIQTQIWLRKMAYERLNTGYGRTLGVFILSAFWHGFYPGYYLSFLLFAVMVHAGRKVSQTFNFNLNFSRVPEFELLKDKSIYQTFISKKQLHNLFICNYNLVERNIRH